MQELLNALDEAQAIIQELMAQLQSSKTSGGGGEKEKKDDFAKKAEAFASKAGIDMREAEEMVKKAEAKGIDPEALLEFMPSMGMQKQASFGKVASEPYTPSESSAYERARARQEDLKLDLGP